jgi:hypothetical protein
MRAILASLLFASVAGAQQWNDARARELVGRATALRARQLADTGLTDYRATAHGYLTFLAQLGEGLREPPKIVKADELVDDIYWRAPNFSKQLIRGRRDTLLLPTDIVYHRDHLGIVQNNFPNAIRVGDGDEVRDVPHPLSGPGMYEYDFAISDSLRVRLPEGTINVYRVLVRPKDDRRARVVGAVYIEPSAGQVVRMAFTFTRAAFLDSDLEDISIVLENGLIDGRFWLPRHQEIEIRRRGTWLDVPFRGIIRGRWEICCYQINTRFDLRPLAGGYEIDSARTNAYPWTGSILDSLPRDVSVATDDDVRRVQENARALVRGAALARAHNTVLSAESISDFVRSNRVEGFALGLGASHGLGDGFSVTGRARYGFDDRQGKGAFGLGWKRADGLGVDVAAYRTYRDAGDFAETSLIVNSLASQTFGADRTDPFDARGVGVGVTLPTVGGWVVKLGTRRERQGGLEVHNTPALGRFEATIPAIPVWATAATLDAERPTFDGPWGTRVQVGINGRAEWNGVGELGHAAGILEVDRDRVITRTTLGVVSLGAIPIQDAVYVGGPVTGPGYDYHAFVGRLAGSEHVEWQLPIPGPAIPLGRYGTTPHTLTLAPFAHVIYFDRPDPIAGRTSETDDGWFPAVGVGLLGLFDIVRLDVARGLRDGRWTFSLDLNRSLWGFF